MIDLDLHSTVASNPVFARSRFPSKATKYRLRVANDEKSCKLLFSCSVDQLEKRSSEEEKEEEEEEEEEVAIDMPSFPKR